MLLVQSAQLATEGGNNGWQLSRRVGVGQAATDSAPIANLAVPDVADGLV